MGSYYVWIQNDTRFLYNNYLFIYVIFGIFTDTLGVLGCSLLLQVIVVLSSIGGVKKSLMLVFFSFFQVAIVFIFTILVTEKLSSDYRNTY